MNEILSNPYFLVLIFIVISAIAIPTTSPDKAVKLAANPSELKIIGVEIQTKNLLQIDIGMDDDVYYCYTSDTFTNLQAGNFYYQKKKADKQQKAELLTAIELYWKTCSTSKKEKLSNYFKDAVK